MCNRLLIIAFYERVHGHMLTHVKCEIYYVTQMTSPGTAEYTSLVNNVCSYALVEVIHSQLHL